MITITRRLEFDAGHRVLGHEGKCKHLHGHRYVAEITVKGPRLDKLGRVVDFGVIKSVIGEWIDSNWDHNILLHPEDPLAPYYAENPESAVLFGGRAPYIFPGGMNPTAENMANYLAGKCVLLLPSNLHLERIRIYETPNCWADYYPTNS